MEASRTMVRLEIPDSTPSRRSITGPRVPITFRSRSSRAISAICCRRTASPRSNWIPTRLTIRPRSSMRRFSRRSQRRWLPATAMNCRSGTRRVPMTEIPIAAASKSTGTASLFTPSIPQRRLMAGSTFPFLSQRRQAPTPLPSRAAASPTSSAPISITSVLSPPSPLTKTA